MTSSILTFLLFHLRSWSGIETLAGDKILKKNGRVYLEGWVSLHVVHDRDGIVAVYSIAKGLLPWREGDPSRRGTLLGG